MTTRNHTGHRVGQGHHRAKLTTAQVEAMRVDHNNGMGYVLLSQFRKWAQSSGARFCVLSRPATMRNCWTIPELGDSFRCAGGRSVAAAWMQNIQDTRAPMDATKALGNCLDCERKACPKNDMTGSLSPGEDRALYGWGAAVKGGIAGRFCTEYTRDGKKSFSRFFSINPCTTPCQQIQCLHGNKSRR